MGVSGVGGEGGGMRERASQQQPQPANVEVEDLSGGKQDLSEDFDIINAWLKQTSGPNTNKTMSGTGQI
jgi:hypothetical protein